MRGLYVGWLSLLVAVGLEGQPLALPDVVREGSVTVRLPVAVRAADGELQERAARALGLHGGLQVVAEDEGRALLEFAARGDGMRLVIRAQGRVLFEEVVEGGVAEAGDLAVAKLLGLPGFFASELAFVGTREGASEIYVAELLLRRLRQVTRGGGPVVQPALSPDADVVLFTSYRPSGFPDIYRIELDSGRRENFAAFSGTNIGAIFAPRGDAVAMVLSGPGNPELFLADAGGKNLRRLTRTEALEADPSFSPDGRALVYASDAPGRPQLFRMDLMSGRSERLATGLSGYCAEPAWNPRDVGQVLFTTSVGRRFRLALLPVERGEAQVLETGPGEAMEGAWLRDGRHVVYTQRTGKQRQLWVLDTVTLHRAPLVPLSWGESAQASVVYAR